MLQASYDHQSSHPGYMDMEFKLILLVSPKDDSVYPILDWRELRDLMLDGFWPEFDVIIPPAIVSYLDSPMNGAPPKGLDCLCKMIMRKYGDTKEASVICQKIDKVLDQLPNSPI